MIENCPVTDHRDRVILVALRCQVHSRQSRRGTFILKDAVLDIFPDATQTDVDRFSLILRNGMFIEHSPYTGAFQLSRCPLGDLVTILTPFDKRGY